VSLRAVFLAKQSPNVVRRLLAMGMLRDQLAKNAGFATTQNKK